MKRNHHGWPFFKQELLREYDSPQSKFRKHNLGNKGISTSAVVVKITSEKKNQKTKTKNTKPKKTQKFWWIQEPGKACFAPELDKPLNQKRKIHVGRHEFSLKQ